MDSKMFQFLAITTMSHVLKSIKRAMIKWCCQVPKQFSKRKLQVVNTKTNRPVHPQPTSSETYNPYAVIVPSTSVFLLELTVNTCRKKERPPTSLVAILNLRARSRGYALTNQTFFASETHAQFANCRACALKNRKPKKWHPVFDYPRACGISIPLTLNAHRVWGRDCCHTG